jgi:hypothetical protein
VHALYQGSCVQVKNCRCSALLPSQIKPRWTRYINSRIRRVELSTSATDLAQNWNICTGTWLRYCECPRNERGGGGFFFGGGGGGGGGGRALSAQGGPAWRMATHYFERFAPTAKFMGSPGQPNAGAARGRLISRMGNAG